MPAGVIRSAVDGPTMILTAGLFPSEYCGIEAAGRLYQRISPADLACGTLIILPSVHQATHQFLVISGSIFVSRRVIAAVSTSRASSSAPPVSPQQSPVACDL